MADIDDIMDDIAKELADPNSALNAEMQGRTPENFNQQEELDKIGRELDAMRNAPQAPNPNAPALYENVPVAQAPVAYSLNVGRMGLGGPTVSGQPGVNQQAYAAVAKAGLNPNTLAGLRAQAAYTQVAEETLDPEAAAAAVEAVAAQVAQGQNMSVAAAVNAGREVAEANYSNTYAADMEALGAPKGYAEDMTSLQGVMAQDMLGPAPATIAARSLAQEALGLTQQNQPAPNELSAMSMMANQAAAEAYSNAIAAGATMSEATIAAQEAAQTAAQQAANQIGIDPNSRAVVEATNEAVNTQAVEVGRLSNSPPEEVAAVAQGLVTAGQQGKIGRQTLDEMGLLNQFGLSITAPEVDARRTREAQELMEQNILAPAPVSPPAPAQNPRGTGRGVSLPVQNPAFQPFGNELRNQHELNAQPPAPPVEAELVNPAFNIEGFTVNQATPAYSEPEQAPVLGTTLGQTAPGLGPNIGLTAPQAFGVTGYSPGFNNLSNENNIGFTDPNAQSPDYTNPEMSAARSFFGAPAPVTSFPRSELESVLQGLSLTSVPGTLTSSTMQKAGMPGFTNPAPLTSMPAALTGFSSSGVSYNAPQISAATQVAPVESFFSAPEPVDPDATPVGPGATVPGVQSSVPGISLDLTPEQSAQVERGNVLGSLSLTPDPPSPNPSRSKSAITSMMDVEEAQQAQQARNAINSMMALEAELGQQQANQAKAERAEELGKLTMQGLPTPAPTTSRSSSSRGGSRGRSSSGRSSRGAAKSAKTRTVATWGPENQVTFSQQAADPSDPGPSCYIATDAVSAGAFSKLDKAKAELWCKRALHNHWAGETVRLGYQALSKRAVANGTASKHYDEFQRFVRYGRGLDKTLKGAVTFYTRMAQFFAVGVINRLKAR